MATPLAIVKAWQDAANSQDVDRLIDLSAAQIEIVGPRGVSYGHQVLRDWLGRAGLVVTTLRAFAQGDAVVLAQHGVWRSVDTGTIQGEADLASAFRVVGQAVTHVARYETLAEALAAVGLSEADECH